VTLNKSKLIKARYFNNELTFEVIPDEEYKNIKKLWVTLREDYSDWVSNVRFKNITNNKDVINYFQWKGMSTWWLNSLTFKDAELDNVWINRLMIIYLTKHYMTRITLETDDKVICRCIKNNFNDFNVTYIRSVNISLKEKLKHNVLGIYLYLLLIRSFLLRLEIYLLFLGEKKKIFNPANEKTRIWFRSTYPANWVLDEGELKDRHIRNIHLFDKKFNLSSSYLMYIMRYGKDKNLNFFSLRNKVKSLKNIIGREVIFPESYIKLYDLFETYYSTFIEYLKFSKLKKTIYFKNLFKINGIDFSDILIEEWKNNYFSKLQYNKLHGLAMIRFLEHCKSSQIIVSYGEFYNQSRYAYFAAKKINPNNMFIAYQHASNSKNLMSSNFRKNEINTNNFPETINYMPTPDYFLVQGEQYKSILKEFYSKERIRVIGSLKNDGFTDLKNEWWSIKRKIEKKYNLLSKNLILLAPSLNDSIHILNGLSNFENDEKNIIMLSPHPATDIEKIKLLQKEICPNLKINYVLGESTYNLLTVAKLVVCGYSTIAIEAALFSVRSVRVAPLGSFPLFDYEELIPTIHSPAHFKKWIENQNLNNEMKDTEKNELFSLAKKYFYKIDGKTADRMWTFIKEQTSLSQDINYPKKKIFVN
jgi:hypothetical protein